MADNNVNRDGWHTFEFDGQQFTIPTRYQEPERVGQGAFGAVIQATDTETGRRVAIKKMLQPFRSHIHAKRTYRELKLLIYLNHPDAQVVQLYNVFTSERNLNEFETLYFVFNYAGYNLHQAIQRRRPFTEYHIRLIIYSLLRASKFMHSAGIIHRDIKPQNIGIDRNSNVTVLDFGLARSASNDPLTGYVATRWWRAPEILLSWERYDEKVDVWSVGCIMAELILLRAAFRGADSFNQINKILEILGTPDQATLQEICTGEVYDYIVQLPPQPRVDFNHLFGFKYDITTEPPVSGVSQQGVDLLARLLSFDHRQRPTAAEALNDPFFETLHDEEDEPTIDRLNDVHQDATYSTDMWKSLIWELMENFRPPACVNDDSDED